MDSQPTYEDIDTQATDGKAACARSASELRTLRVLLAIDSFKGCATSEQVEAWLSEGILRSAPDACVATLPIADGGEGTAAAVQAACGGAWREVAVRGPLGASVNVRYVLVEGEGDARADEARSAGARSASAQPAGARPDGAQPTGAPPVGATPYAVIEMAEAAGIGYSSRTHTDALAATTYGVGEMALDARRQGARTLYLGIGGSATNDGGAGFLQALGAQLLDADGHPIAPGLAGLADVASIDLAPAARALAGVELVVLTDVENPLVGPHGALATFGPQKGLQLDGAGGKDAEDAAHAGADAEDAAHAGASAGDTRERAGGLATYDEWMRAYAAKLSVAREALDESTPTSADAPATPSLADAPGAGAAGGLGAALLALGAQLTPGIQTVLDLIGFDEAVRQADFVITGEGNMDAQTAHGKAPVGVAERARAANPQVIVAAVCGGRDSDLDAVYARGIDFALPIARRPMPLEQALSPQETHANLVAAGETLARIMRLM